MLHGRCSGVPISSRAYPELEQSLVVAYFPLRGIILSSLSYYYYNKLNYLLFLLKLVAPPSCNPILQNPISKKLVQQSIITKYKKFKSLITSYQELLQPPQ